MIIGIDFSINSTGITISDGDSYEVFSFVPNYKEGKSPFKTHEFLKSSLKLYSYNKNESSKDSIEDQCIKLKNADDLSNIIMETLEIHLKDKPDEIRIEGFSYASKGNSFIDLIVYNTFLKLKLIQKYGHIIKVYPPKTLKKLYTGNGNASKCDMLRFFVDNDKTPLCDKIKELNIVTDEEFKIPKPIDDLCDSIALTMI